MRTLNLLSIASAFSFVFCFWSEAQAAPAPRSISAIQTTTTADVYIDSEAQIESTVLYSCDSLEGRAQNILEKLGATKISTDCSGEGGDSERPTFSPTLTLQFSAPRLPGQGITGPAVQAHWKKVTLSGFDNCEATRQILSGLKDHFSIRNFQGALEPDSCFSTDSSYDYSFEVLIAQ